MAYNDSITLYKSIFAIRMAADDRELLTKNNQFTN